MGLLDDIADRFWKFFPRVDEYARKPQRAVQRPKWCPERWIGREVEYRDGGRLRDNGLVWRGRIIELETSPYGDYTGYARVRPTHVSAITLKCERYGMINRYKTKYYVAFRKKIPWSSRKNKSDHILMWSGYRWKCVGDANSFSWIGRI